VRWKILVEALCSAAEWWDAIYMMWWTRLIEQLFMQIKQKCYMWSFMKIIKWLHTWYKTTTIRMWPLRSLKIN
jgi:hypothetical protein